MMYNMAGFEVTPENTIKTTYLTKMPEAFKIKPYATLSAAEINKRNKFYQKLAELTGKDVVTLWKNMNYALPTGNWVAAFMGALNEDLDIYQAGAIANYAGGAVRYKGLTGLSDVTQDSDDFLNVDKLYSVGTNQTVPLSSALLKLKAVNPGAHEYAIHVIAAKAAKRKEQDAIILAKETKKVIEKELEIAKKVASLPINLVEGAADTAAAAGKALSYLPWIIGGTLVLVAYFAYKNRETIGKIAASTALRAATRGAVG